MTATLKRFFSRRGKSDKLYSDNAINTVGAKAELKKLSKLVSAQMINFHLRKYRMKIYSTQIASFWRASGSWGKECKSLIRTVGKMRLNYEESETIII